MGVRVSKFQGATDPIARSQPFISTFLRDAAAELDSDNTAASDSHCNAETVTAHKLIPLDSDYHLEYPDGCDYVDASYRDVSVSAADRKEMEAATSAPAIASTNALAMHSAPMHRSPRSRHPQGADLQFEKRDPTQSSSANHDRENKRKRSFESGSGTQKSSNKRSPQGWVCSVCTFRNTSSRGGVLLPWCAMCPDGRRFPTSSKRARLTSAVEHVRPDGCTSRNGSQRSSVRRKASRPIHSFFAVDQQLPLPKPSPDRRIPSDDLINKFVDITRSGREDAIKRLTLTANNIDAAIDIYFRKDS